MILVRREVRAMIRGLACLAIVVGWGSFAHAADIDTVRERYVADLLSSVASATTVNNYRDDMSSNGSWSDINYSSTSDVSWVPLTHLDRLEAMCEAYAKSSHSLYHDTGLKADILKAYDYWISRDPASSNWYYNEISAPQQLGNVMVLINDILSTTRRNNGLDLIERAYQPRSNNGGTNTGQNRVERAQAGIARGLIADSTSITADAFAAIGDTLVITTGDGIQRDNSFHQHGNQLYNSGYGSAFVDSAIYAVELNAGTDFAFSSAKTTILIDHILDSTQWMVRGQVIDYLASGRNLTRKSQGDSASSLSGQLNDLLNANIGYRTAELTAMRQRILAANDTGSNSTSLSLTGNRQFWQSDFMVHQRPNYYASVKTSSTRTIQPEYGNNEGLKSLYLGDGVNLIMRTGNEYDDMMPVWNWRRLPGTTVEQDSRSLTPTGEFGVAGTATFAGGVSDGLYGATGFKYDRFNVAANKGWFFFDNEFVGLGANIDAPDSVKDVNTTLNQSLLRGTVSYKTSDSGSIKTIALGDAVTPSNLQWVFHDGTGYFFPTPVDNATLQAIVRTGTWEDINARYDAAEVSKNVFSLYVNHGRAFSNGSYNYIVVPGLAVGDMNSYLADNPIEILRNSSSGQAIRQTNTDVTQAVFYSAGSVSLGSSQSFAVSDPSAVIMRRPTNTLQFTAASPEAKSFELDIDLTSIKFQGSGSSWLDGFSKDATITLGLPSGDRAGDSVGIAISSDGDTTPVIRWTTFDTPTTFAYTTSAALALPGNTTFSAGSNKTLTFKGIISGNASVTKTGAHDLVLSGVNTYSGGTRIFEGNVTVSGDQRNADGGWTLGPDSEDATNVTFVAGSRVTVRSDKGIYLGADTARGEARQQLNSLGTVINNGELYLGRYADLNISGGSWTQTGEMTIYAKGSDSFSPVLEIGNGASFTYNGSTTIKINPSDSSTGDASLIIGNTDGVGTFSTNRGFERTLNTGDGASIIRLRNAGILKLTANVPQLVDGNIDIRIGDGGGIIDTNGFSTTINEPIVNATDTNGGLTKRGNGTLELTRGNTYQGTTTVADGILRVNNTSGSGTGTGPVVVQSGATFGGTGQITGGLTIQSSAKLAPGNSIGILDVGNVNFSSAASVFAAEIQLGQNNAADLLNVTGTLTLANSTLMLDLSGLLGTSPQTFLLIQNDLSEAISGKFNSLQFSGGGTYTYALDYKFTGTDSLGRVGNGNDLAITFTPVAIPEPGIWCGCVGAIALLYRRYKTSSFSVSV